MNDNKKFWSKVARIYEKFIKSGKGAKIAYNDMELSICQYMNKNMRVLELAAGPGIMSTEISKHCGFLEITDFSSEMLEQAQRRKIKGNVNFAVADATNIMYKNESFDAVVIANALHIIPEPKKALHEIKRVITKNGILISPIFTRDKVKSKLKEQMMELIGFRTYSRWTQNLYLDFLKEQGFIIIEKKMIYGHNFPICFVVCKKQEEIQVERYT